MNKQYRKIAFLPFMLLTMAGCQDYNPISSGDIPFSAFDFATSHNVDIDIDYGNLAAYAPVDIYDADPMRQATAENQQPQGEPINSLVLSADGTYHGKMRIPTAARHLYLYSPSMGAPMLMEADVVGDHVSAQRAATNYNRAQTRATDDAEGPYPGLRKIEGTEVQGSNPGNFYTLNGDFNAYGKTEDVNGLWTKGNIASKDIYGVQNTLWGGKTSKPSSFSNFNSDGKAGNHERFGVDNVNMCIDETYTKNDTIYDVESAEAYVTFMGEYAWNENSFGYYYYDKNDKPSNVNALKKIIIMPNASVGGHPPFGLKNEKRYSLRRRLRHPSIPVTSCSMPSLMPMARPRR